MHHTSNVNVRGIALKLVFLAVGAAENAESLKGVIKDSGT